ncbi:hypothetical protein PQX77_010182 [Marasmius sp. AFHP31]|nr:hypothetical protein PQX77_010182 [Marasmius sp. AFHP31]
MASSTTPSAERRTALVTGAARGIGRGIALKLAEDGFNVAINDIPSMADTASNTLEEIKKVTESKGARASLHLADVSSESQVIEMIEGVVKAHGSLDVMVANAGIVQWNTLVDTPMELADKIISVNIRGVILCYKYAAKQMISQGRGGRIIGASSCAGKQGYALLPVYSASKFAVRGLTQATAREVGPHKITVNAYAPGCIETDMIEYLEDRHVEMGNGTHGDLKSASSSLSSLKYNGTPTEIASLVGYLASPGAHFITGQTIICDGGTIFD